MEEGKRRNGETGTSEKDKAMDRRGVEGEGVREVGKSGQVGRLGPEGCGCAGEDGRDETEDSGG